MSTYTVRWVCPIRGVPMVRVFHGRPPVEKFLALPRVEPLKELQVKCHHS